MRGVWLALLLVAGCLSEAPGPDTADDVVDPSQGWLHEHAFSFPLGPGGSFALVGVFPMSAEQTVTFDVPADARRLWVESPDAVGLFLSDPQGRQWCAVKTGRCDAPVGPNGTGTWTLRVVSLAMENRQVQVSAWVTTEPPVLADDAVPAAGWPVHVSGRRGGEPTLAVTPDGSVMVVAGNDVLRLAPDGTWIDVTPPIDSTVDVTLDPFLVGDPLTGKVYVSQLATCQRISWTQDGGNAWTSQPLGCGGPDQHHQKLAIGPAGPASIAGRALHMMTMNLATWLATDEVAITHAVSLDDGRTWTQNPAMVPAVHGLEARAIGNVAVADDGSVHAVAYLCDAFNGAPYEGIGAGVSRDLGTTWTWQKIAPGGGTCQGIDPGIAVRGTEVHVVGWDASAGEQRLWHIASTDRGATWGEPAAIPTPGLGSFVLADLAASQDRLAAMFLATPDSGLGPNEAEGWARWFPYVAIHNGTAWDVVRLEDHPVQLGRICMEGPTCFGSSRNLLDFNDVQFGPDGRIHAAYTDGCAEECTQAWQSRGATLRVAIEA